MTKSNCTTDMKFLFDGQTLENLSPAITHELEPSNHPIAWAFLAQFVAHDLTFTVNGLNITTACLDLDCLFGDRDRHHFAYQEDGSFNLEVCREFVVIPDKRNNDNPNIFKIHLAYMEYYNRLIFDGRNPQQAKAKTIGVYQYHVDEMLSRFVLPISSLRKSKLAIDPPLYQEFARAAFRWHALLLNEDVLRANTVAELLVRKCQQFACNVDIKTDGGPTLFELNRRASLGLVVPKVACDATNISPVGAQASSASLFEYLMLESKTQYNGERLGLLGSDIVSAQFCGKTTLADSQGPSFEELIAGIY